MYILIRKKSFVGFFLQLKIQISIFQGKLLENWRVKKFGVCACAVSRGPPVVSSNWGKKTKNWLTEVFLSKFVNRARKIVGQIR